MSTVLTVNGVNAPGEVAKWVSFLPGEGIPEEILAEHPTAAAGAAAGLDGLDVHGQQHGLRGGGLPDVRVEGARGRHVGVGPGLPRGAGVRVPRSGLGVCGMSRPNPKSEIRNSNYFAS